MGRRGAGWLSDKNDSATKVIDASTARALLKMFGDCYHTGVKDAFEVGDELVCEDFAREVRVPGVYGRVIHPYKMNIREWGFHIIGLIRNATAGDVALAFMRRILKKNFLTCALPLAQEFYIWGLEDYNKAPTSVKPILNDGNRTLIRWTKNGIKFLSTNEVLMRMQEFCFMRTRIDEESDSKEALKAQRYDWFSRAIWIALLPRK